MKQPTALISVTDTVNSHHRGIRHKTVKSEAAKCMQVFVEKKAMLLHCRHDHCSSGVMINRDFQSPILDCLSLEKYKDG